VPWDPALQNQTIQATLAEIDQKGMVRVVKNAVA
jgi:hypothetical protein